MAVSRSTRAGKKADPTEKQGAAAKPQADTAKKGKADKAKAAKEQVLRGLGTAGVEGAAAATSRIVQKAASILEEEIAAGIVAAKQVEARYVNVSELRQGQPEEVLLRFRRDAHEVLDMLMDMASLATRSVGNLAQRVVSVRPGEQPTAATGHVPSFTLPGPLNPGETASVPMTLENQSDTVTDEFSFHCSDLVSPSGDRISAQNVLFAPPTVVIEPRKTEQVIVTVVAPDGLAPGLYAGLLQSSRPDQLRAVLVVNVK